MRDRITRTETEKFMWEISRPNLIIFVHKSGTEQANDHAIALVFGAPPLSYVGSVRTEAWEALW